MAVLGRKKRWLVEKLEIVKKLARRRCFVVYAGEERECRDIPMRYLKSIRLQELLDQCRDRSDKGKGIYLCYSPRLLNWVLKLAKAEVEETDPNPVIKRDGIIHANMCSMRSFSNSIVVV